MKIYTKKGDRGQTSLANGRRIAKNSLILDQIGALDELNSDLGLVLAAGSLGRGDSLRAVVALSKADQLLLRRAQANLFCFGGLLAKPAPVVAAKLNRNFDSADVERLEERIDYHSERLEPLRNFILPGGVELAARLHRARTTCRRAERQLIQTTLKPAMKAYLNRLSDYLFVLARVANKQAHKPDITWSSTP
ncbi:MAG: cob(I)yrinic acid a,c-diamide adenosyltransferase [bacterium]|nr:cob(I)yrinic acid a,c-diamide adenosyltransferase [bacterium]